MDIVMRRRQAVACVLLAVYGVVLPVVAADRPPSLGGDPAPLADHVAEGMKTASRLQARYDDGRTDCGGPSLPAFLCSGVLLRGTDASPLYRSWNPNPNSAKPAGVSFSFLRKDAQFSKLAYGYNHGFMIYPVLDDPPGKRDLEVLCAFPIDAATDERSSAGGAVKTPGNTGCGMHPLWPQRSAPCEQVTGVRQNNPVDTTDEWVANYRFDNRENPRKRQCGYTMKTGTRNSAALFMEVLDDMHRLNGPEPGKATPSNESFGTQDELVLAAWPQDDGANVPLEAFFFVEGTAGIDGARFDQADFSNRVSIWRPVIRVRLASTVDGRATFAYVPDDQAIR